MIHYTKRLMYNLLARRSVATPMCNRDLWAICNHKNWQIDEEQCADCGYRKWDKVELQHRMN